MSLITHAALQGNLRQGGLRCEHEFLGSLHATLGYVGDRRFTKRPTKGAEEMTRAQPNETGEFTRSDSRVEPFVDVGSQTLDLPGGEPVLQIRMLRPGDFS